VIEFRSPRYRYSKSYLSTVWDPHPFYADPDPEFEIFAYSDPMFKMNIAGLDPGLYFPPPKK